MKKIINLTLLFILLVYISACAGYKPIFSSNLNFQIADYSIQGDKKLGRQIYEKMFRTSNSNKNKPESQSIVVFINSKKKREATAKSDTGKILEYRISLNSHIVIKDYLNNDQILNQNFDYTSSYKVQDQHSETKNLENKTLENLIDRTYQDILMRMSEKVST